MVEGINVKLDLTQPLAEINIPDNVLIKPESEDNKTTPAVNTKNTEESKLVSFEPAYEEENLTSDDIKAMRLEILQRQYDNELNNFLFYQKQITETKKEISEYEGKILQYKSNPKTAQRYQTKLEGLNSKLDGYTKKMADCKTNMQELMSKINAMLQNTDNNSIPSYSNYTMPVSKKTAEESTGTKTVSSSKNTAFLNTYTGQSTLSKDVANALDKRLGNGFSAKCESVASYIGCNVNDLLAMMYSESGLKTSAKNKSSNAVGLIQFIPSTLKANGYSTEQVASMSAIEQLDVVADIFMKSKKMAGYSAGEKISGGTLYAINWLPAFAKNDTIVTKGGKYYSKGLDMNKDGTVTKADLEKRLQKKYNEMLNNI